MNDYVQTVQSGIKMLPWPRQMEELFGDSDHFILYYGTAGEQKIWHSRVYFYGRYSLTMETTVEIDDKSKTIRNFAGPPKFYLHEVKSVEVDRGRVTTSFSDQWVLDEAQWKKLVAAKGNWSVIGIILRTNEPVPGFDAYVKGQRDPIEKIPH
jgi:hypothetical protein